MKQSRYVAIRTSFLTLVLMYVSSCMPWVSVLTISHLLSINVLIVFLLDVSSYISYMPLSVSPLMLSLLYHYQGMSFDAIFYMPLSMPISSYAISFIFIGHAYLPLCYLLCMPIAICMCISFPPITLAFSLLMVSCAPMYWHYVDNRLSRLFFFFFFWVTTLISLDLVKTNPTYFFSLQHKLKKTSLFIGREISGNSSFRFCISFVLSNKKLKRPSSQNKIIIGRRSFSQLFSFL